MASEVPSTVAEQLLTGWVLGQQTWHRELDLAFRRQGDGAAFDMRALGAVAANELLVSNDPSEISRLNAAVRTPTTIDHPSAKVG